ncbi:Sac3 ganp family protein [Lasiodiplodia theobromae]|uniref:Sac3 ganp family protein n=1 Tax=Lasiodiplodia theobromae TaxID=45133 RepID=UPI0015C3B5E2|nr:Sac3 ganp family protein [Lasiodiplodia theobromae]KAF4544186.1 Sac3 ganp family protein [Lasiodiplodia theobromae]
MPPYAMSAIDDSSDVGVSRGFRPGRSGVTAANHSEHKKPVKGHQHDTAVAHIADDNGRKSHSLLRHQAKPSKLASLIDDSSDIGDRKPSKKHAAHPAKNKNEFDDVDPGEEEAFKRLMAKVKKACKTGSVETEDGKWKYDLHLVRGNKTHSLLNGSAVNDSSSAKNKVSSRPGNVPSGTLKQTSAPQEHAGLTRHAKPAVCSNQKVTVSDHVGGVPVLTTPRKREVLVAHEITDEERASKPTAHVVHKKYSDPKGKMPRYGILIPGADGKIRLVNSANGPVLTCRGAEPRRSRPVNVKPTPVAQPPAPATEDRTNYQAPTVESASDSGDLAGLFD